MHKALGADLVNGTDGGEGVIDRSGEIARKIGDAHRGKFVSEETRRRISEAHKGRKFSEEHKQKIRKIPEQVVDEVVKDYLDGKTTKQISSHTGISVHHVLDLLRRRGCKTKTRQEALCLSAKASSFIKRMKEIGVEVAAMPEKERRRKFTAPRRLLPPDVYRRIIELKALHPDWSNRRIAAEVGTNHHVVKKTLIRIT